LLDEKLRTCYSTRGYRLGMLPAIHVNSAFVDKRNECHRSGVAQTTVVCPSTGSADLDRKRASRLFWDMV